ncbi:hypothetical protein LUZ60_017719 [Juncus effusus]|nr:hypothetical protein LUZ60_017719 [Juncus effusus]
MKIEVALPNNNEFEKQMAVASLYRRVLPSPPAIEFASPHGKVLFSEALQNGTMVGFFRLISYFQTQQEPAYCGLATLSVVLNALAIDPRRKWKGVWRWFDETMLDCCEPLEKVKTKGITFAKVECLAHCAGAKVVSYRANESTIDEFRNHVMRCVSSEECHLIVSYDRKTFKQTGGGHFSPIGGYHAEKDMVLILDVARFKYPPHWVPLPLLWEAMNTIDQATGRLRGFMLISRLQESPTVLYTVSCKHDSWLTMAKYLTEDVPQIIKSDNLHTIEQLLSTLFESLPTNAGDFIKCIVEIKGPDEGRSDIITQEERERLSLKEKLMKEIMESKLYKLVNELIGSKSPFEESSKINEDLLNITNELDKVVLSENLKACCGSNVECLKSNHALTILIFALENSTWSHIKDEKLLAEMQDLVCNDSISALLQQEVMHLRRQILLLKTCADEES